MPPKDKPDYSKWILPIVTLVFQAGGWLAMNDNFRERLKSIEQTVLQVQIKLQVHDTILGVFQQEIERLRGRR